MGVTADFRISAHHPLFLEIEFLYYITSFFLLIWQCQLVLMVRLQLNATVLACHITIYTSIWRNDLKREITNKLSIMT